MAIDLAKSTYNHRCLFLLTFHGRTEIVLCGFSCLVSPADIRCHYETEYQSPTHQLFWTG